MKVVYEICNCQAYTRWVEEHEEEELLPGVNYTQTQLFFLNFAHVRSFLSVTVTVLYIVQRKIEN